MKGDSISMTSVGKKVYETPRGDPLYFPSPYATTHISVYSGDNDSPSGGPRGHQTPASAGAGTGGGTPISGRPEHTYDVPFPPKQYPVQTSRDFNGDSHYTSIFRTNSTANPDGQWEELLLETASYNPAETRYDRLPRQRFSLYGQKTDQKAVASNERISDEESNQDEAESRGFEGNTAPSENMEMSEAECDRDFQIYSKKGRNMSLVQYAKTRPVHSTSYVTYH